jgi:hypothetical protein
MRGGIGAVGVEMDVGEADSRASSDQLASVGIEYVGISPDFVDGPRANPETAA